MKKQTAVQWLIEYINSDKYQTAFGKTYISPVIIDQAKAIEKEQIKKAYIMGWITREHKPIKTEISNSTYAEQYYDEIYANTTNPY